MAKRSKQSSRNGLQVPIVLDSPYLIGEIYNGACVVFETGEGLLSTVDFNYIKSSVVDKATRIWGLDFKGKLVIPNYKRHLIMNLLCGYSPLPQQVGSTIQTSSRDRYSLFVERGIGEVLETLFKKPFTYVEDLIVLANQLVAILEKARIDKLLQLYIMLEVPLPLQSVVYRDAKVFEGLFQNVDGSVATYRAYFVGKDINTEIVVEQVV